MNTNLNRRAQSADIALLLEGTFPYVSGGVSAWVNQMIRAFPEFTFAIVFIGSRRQDYGKPRYELPDNVVHFEEHYIHEATSSEPVQTSAGNKHVFERVAHMHDELRKNKNLGAIGRLMREVIPMLADGGDISEQQFLHSKRSWDFITDHYEKYCTDPSFTDYFWTIRIMHKPLWQLARIAENLIPAKVYHTVSTGYAGFLGALLHFRTERPLLVSEHGIYTKERKIDLLQSQWIRDNRGIFEKDISQVGYFQDLWVRFFEAMGRVCYEAANDIVSLYEGNRLRQIRDGAPETKTRSIPNGIAVGRFAALRDRRPADVPLVVALIGRVVPIKDIKTFIRAIFIASRKLPALQGWIVGPETEDPEYVRECRELVGSLGLQDNLKFLGFRKVDELLPEIGLVALSSISEALPLVVLEAFAAGIPVVTTDVGSCRELVEGMDDADRALGCAGSVVQIANPELFSQSILGLLEQPSVWRAAQQAGIARVERYYTDTLMEDSYRGLYQKLTASRADGSPKGDQ
ncbi:GT4 family glycosyltransferase PelF [Paralcaligenes ginsengisoli]